MGEEQDGERPSGELTVEEQGEEGGGEAGTKGEEPLGQASAAGEVLGGAEEASVVIMKVAWTASMMMDLREKELDREKKGGLRKRGVGAMGREEEEEEVGGHREEGGSGAESQRESLRVTKRLW